VHDDVVKLSHGAGGVLTKKLIEHTFLKNFRSPVLLELEDSAVLSSLKKGKLAFTTDSYVVSPLFFPEGDIGELSINGTVNDLVAVGARPLYISAGFIIEEGLPIPALEKVVRSMSGAAKEAGVQVVAADTKVVEHGKADGLFINTAGIGVIEGHRLGRDNIKARDAVIVSGTMGDHGATILLSRKRDELKFDTKIRSDCAPLNGMLLPIFKEFGSRVHWVRDVTRGGLFTILNEAIDRSKYEIDVRETDIPVDPEVRSICDLLGLDPFYLANEGKVALIVDCEIANLVIERLKKHRYGKKAAIIGTVKRGDGRVYVETPTGGLRIADSLLDDPVPRIC
jgi:hydrogenase expression/formation protein HypE